LSFSPMLPPPPPSSLFPYTTLFRSNVLMNRGRFRCRTVTRCGCAPSLLSAVVSRAVNVSKSGSKEGGVFIGHTSRFPAKFASHRSEEHTSELQSRGHLVCRLLLEKQ